MCVCPLSCQGIAAYSQPPLQHSYQPSHQPQSHLSMLSLWAMRQENASQEPSCKHTVPESITSLFPSLYSRFALSLSLWFILRFIQIGLYNIVAAGWMSVEGRREIGGQSYCHSNWDKDLAYALPPPPVSVTCLGVSRSQHNPLVCSSTCCLCFYHWHFFSFLSLLLSSCLHGCYCCQLIFWGNNQIYVV